MPRRGDGRLATITRDPLATVQPLGMFNEPCKAQVGSRIVLSGH